VFVSDRPRKFGADGPCNPIYDEYRATGEQRIVAYRCCQRRKPPSIENICAVGFRPGSGSSTALPTGAALIRNQDINNDPERADRTSAFADYASEAANWPTAWKRDRANSILSRIVVLVEACRTPSRSTSFSRGQ
jgi:hypothetical protein